jgi:putative membrane protein
MMESEYEMTLRDRLALDRTYMAKERTILAYIRTGIAVIGMVLLIYQFLEITSAQKALLSLAIISLSVYAAVVGMRKTLLLRKKRRDFEIKDLR